MSRTNLKVSQSTKDALDGVKRSGETWDDCLMRLVQLERATKITGEEINTNHDNQSD